MKQRDQFLSSRLSHKRVNYIPFFFALESNPEAISIGSTSKTHLQFCTSTSVHPQRHPGPSTDLPPGLSALTGFYSTPANLQSIVLAAGSELPKKM